MDTHLPFGQISAKLTQKIWCENFFIFFFKENFFSNLLDVHNTNCPICTHRTKAKNCETSLKCKVKQLRIVCERNMHFKIDKKRFTATGKKTIINFLKQKRSKNNDTKTNVIVTVLQNLCSSKPNKTTSTNIKNVLIVIVFT